MTELTIADVHSFVWPEIRDLFFECTNIPVCKFIPRHSLCLYRFLPLSHTDSQNDETDQDLPQQICFECLYRCEQWSNFKTMCHSVNEKLQKAKNSPPTEDESLLKVIVKTEESPDESVMDTYPTTYTVDDSDEKEDQEKVISKNSIISRQFWRSQTDPGAATACPLCQEECGDLCDHLMRVHVQDDKMRCPICFIRYTVRYSLKKHLMTHTHKRPFQCSLCPMSFAHRMWRRNHMARVHPHTVARLDPSLLTGVHKCPLCNYTEAPSNLKSHFVVHTKERPYVCVYCGKDFTQVSNCKRHVRKEHQGKSVDSGIAVKEGSIFNNPHPWEELGYFLE